jgi:aerobic-type carbon monoxide dehydrogenase small subunit (CoxS/CutS family)
MPEKGKPALLAEATIHLDVNGDLYVLKVQAGWTLLYVLRQQLGLMGTKELCDGGACGACAVIVEGRAVLSCLTLAIDCDGQQIETIEGIARSRHPLIEAYVKHNCMQCGYCTPGFIVTAKALLDNNPDPSEEQVRQALAGNLCRCGTYPQHVKAVLEAARKLRGG